MPGKNRVALVTIHGMGDTDRDFHKPFAAKQSKYLGEAAWG
jgi:hypothetical protein